VTIHDVEQRSSAWVSLRLGRLTASRAADMLAENSKGEASGRRNLRMQLVLERVMGRSNERDYTSRAMQDGIDREDEAAAHYQALTGTLIEPVGFVTHDELMAGCSPDSFVGDDGIVSIKCPIPATHWDYLKTGKVPGEYLKQIVAEFWITGRTWCHWLSYQPDFPEALQAKLVKVYRDEKAVAEYDAKARVFLQEVDAEAKAVQTMADLGYVLRESVAS
jgi:hypothetical protein